jgi:hypothetical protein
MVEATEGAGTQTVKLRGGMAFLGATRIFGLYRFANLLALADAKNRGVGPGEAHGARGWDSYSWHTDLPPGHPMVTGAQTNDFDLFTVEHSKLCLVWGVNWITTKMPDSHWLTEARLKGTKVVTVTVEYSATASKGDEVVVIRPGTDPAFALGLAQVILSRQLYDRAWVEANTDLPFLVRMDTLAPLRPGELDPAVLPGYRARRPGGLEVIEKGKKAPPGIAHRARLAPADLLADLGDYVVLDQQGRFVAVGRDQVGAKARGVSPDLGAARKVKLVDGKEVEVRTHFSLLSQYLDENMTPAQVERLTGSRRTRSSVPGWPTARAWSPTSAPRYASRRRPSTSSISRPRSATTRAAARSTCRWYRKPILRRRAGSLERPTARAASSLTSPCGDESWATGTAGRALYCNSCGAPDRTSDSDSPAGRAPAAARRRRSGRCSWLLPRGVRAVLEPPTRATASASMLARRAGSSSRRCRRRARRPRS